MTNSKLFLSLLVAGAVATGTAGAQSLKDAKEAIQAEQYDEAKSMLQNLVEKRAKKGENYFYVGQIRLVNDKVDSAQIVFQEGLTNDPKEKLNTVGLGVVDLQKGDAAAAEQKFAEATDGIRKRDYELLYYAGRGYIDAPTPDYQKAVEYLTRAKEMNTKDMNRIAWKTIVKNNPRYIVFLSSRSDELSAESPLVGSGFLTNGVIKGLRGKADSNDDKKITVMELFKYVHKDVQLHNNKQHPQLVTSKSLYDNVLMSW